MWPVYAHLLMIYIYIVYVVMIYNVYTLFSIEIVIVHCNVRLPEGNQLVSSDDQDIVNCTA